MLWPIMACYGMMITDQSGGDAPQGLMYKGPVGHSVTLYSQDHSVACQHTHTVCHSLWHSVPCRAPGVPFEGGRVTVAPSFICKNVTPLISCAKLSCAGREQILSGKPFESCHDLGQGLAYTACMLFQHSFMDTISDAKQTPPSTAAAHDTPCHCHG